MNSFQKKLLTSHPKDGQTDVGQSLGPTSEVHGSKNRIILILSSKLKSNIIHLYDVLENGLIPIPLLIKNYQMNLYEQKNILVVF